MGLYAILIAGGTLPKRMQHLADSPVKALLTLGGRSLLEQAATAAEQTKLFDGIAAVGNAEVRQATPPGCVYVPMGETMIDNVANAYRHFGGDIHDYVVISPDLPFLEASGLKQFIVDAVDCSDIAGVRVSRTDFLDQFPGAPNKFERLDGELTTLGSVFYANGPSIRKNIPLVRDLYAARKRPWRLAVFLGFPVLWGYLTGRLVTKAVEQRLSRLLDSRFRAVPASDAGLAYDIDTMENYEFAVKQLLTEADQDR